MSFHQINQGDDLPRMITVARAAGSVGLAELLCAARDNEIALFNPLPDTSTRAFKSWCNATANQPAIVLIGDDDGLDRGPPGWPLAVRTLRWAKRLMVHGAAAKREHYRIVIRSTQVHRRIAVIECSSGTLDPWLQLVRGLADPPPAFVIVPIGGLHPIPPASGQTH